MFADRGSQHRRAQHERYERKSVRLRLLIVIRPPSWRLSSVNYDFRSPYLRICLTSLCYRSSPVVPIHGLSTIRIFKQAAISDASHAALAYGPLSNASRRS
ncbi:hypothetical protein NMY22_g15838 [Coprinellus aureogranulatus]|nr:hypothetical protein NMY22_g15838 [Coprinellus aureogranulatus]